MTSIDVDHKMEKENLEVTGSPVCNETLTEDLHSTELTE